jgi:uncharacterized protein YcnI
MRLYRFGFIALFIVSLVPSVAAAHITIATGPATANKTGQKVAFAISHGCTAADKVTKLDTLSIQVDIPAGIDPASVRPMPSDFAPTPVVTRNGTAVTAVKWTRSAADLQDGDLAYYEVTLRLKVNDVPFTRIPFVVTQVCRPRGGSDTGADDVTVVWTGPPTEAEPSPQLVVVPAHTPGWNKLTLTTGVAVGDFGAFFGDAQIVWKGTAAFSPNASVSELIGTTAGATLLDAALASGDTIWVKY